MAIAAPTAILGWITYYILPYSPLIVICALSFTSVASVSAISSLLHKRWYPGALHAVPLLIVIFLYSGYGVIPLLKGIGIRAELYRTGQFSSESEQSIFYENGVKKEVRHYTTIKKILFPDGEFYILFDSTGEIMKTPAERTQAWKHAVEALPLGHLIARSALRTKRMTGFFYEIYITGNDSEA